MDKRNNLLKIDTFMHKVCKNIFKYQWFNEKKITISIISILTIDPKFQNSARYSTELD